MILCKCCGMNKWPYSPNFVFQKIYSFSLFQAFNIKNYF